MSVNRWPPGLLGGFQFLDLFENLIRFRHLLVRFRAVFRSELIVFLHQFLILCPELFQFVFSTKHKRSPSMFVILTALPSEPLKSPILNQGLSRDLQAPEIELRHRFEPRHHV